MAYRKRCAYVQNAPNRLTSFIFCASQASYARAGKPWMIGDIRGRNYRPCIWVEEHGQRAFARARVLLVTLDQSCHFMHGTGCRLGDNGFNCRDPDVGDTCIDVWDTAVGGQTCGRLARVRAHQLPLLLDYMHTKPTKPFSWKSAQAY
eukprot:6180114-Pleurochrysis_carterae.AAC.1